jgi:hypothetical protein
MALILPDTQKRLVAGKGEELPTSWTGDGGWYSGRLYPADTMAAIAVGDVIPFVRLPLDSRMLLLQVSPHIDAVFRLTGNFVLSYSPKDGDASRVDTGANFLITIAAVDFNVAGGHHANGTSGNLLISNIVDNAMVNKTRLAAGNSIRNVYYTLLEAGAPGRGAVLNDLQYCFISFVCTTASGVAMPANAWCHLDAQIVMPNQSRGYTVVD